MNKFEQLVEHIINDEEDKARELFHEIVVEKSRDIYEGLIDETDLEEVAVEEEGEVSELADEIEADEAGISEEEDEEGEEEVDYDDDGEQDEHEEDHEEIEDRVEDLEDALDELKAEFDALMAGEAEEVPAEEPEMEMPEEMPMEESTESEEETVEESEEETVEESEEEVVREYVEKAPEAVKSEEGATQKKSPVAGKNDMGGKNVDVTAGGEEKGGHASADAKMPHADGYKNVPGAKAKLETAPKAKTKE